MQIIRLKPDMLNQFLLNHSFGNGFEYIFITLCGFAEFDAEGAQLKATEAAAEQWLGEKASPVQPTAYTAFSPRDSTASATAKRARLLRTASVLPPKEHCPEFR